MPFQVFIWTWHCFPSWHWFLHMSLLLIYVEKSLCMLHGQLGMGQFLLTLIKICGKEIHRADQIECQVSESWIMDKHRKPKSWKLAEKKARGCKKCHQHEKIWSDIEIRFAAKLDGNVYEILENVFARFAEYSKKMSKHTVDMPKSRSIRFCMIYYIVVSGQKCGRLHVFFCFYIVW